MRLIVPVIARAQETFESPELRTVRIAKARGTLTVSADRVEGFEAVPKERTFNPVPGFEANPLAVALQAGKETRLRILATVKG
jgi:hypothetical protein